MRKRKIKVNNLRLYIFLIFLVDKIGTKCYIVYCQRNGGLAQLVRAPALQAGGHRFESYILHHIFVSAEIAQLIEQLTCNQ